MPGWAGGDSSDGHTHAAPELARADIPMGVAAPRASAASEEFELVATLEGKQLRVYLDRFASNEPVVKATLEIEGAGLKGAARETAPGTYVMELTAEPPPGRHPLLISVEAGDSADLLTAVLELSSPTTGATSSDGWRRHIGWFGGLGVTLLLAAGALLLARRRATAKGLPR